MMYACDVARARVFADSALAALANEARDTRQPWNAFLSMAQAHSILGHRRESLDMYARTEAALPASLDVFVANDRENTKVMILTNLGDYDGAITQMEKRVDVVGGIPRNYLRLNPRFAPMRANPRFQRLIQQ